jgi:hypothetical protein
MLAIFNFWYINNFNNKSNISANNYKNFKRKKTILVNYKFFREKEQKKPNLLEKIETNTKMVFQLSNWNYYTN